MIIGYAIFQLGANGHRLLMQGFIVVAFLGYVYPHHKYYFIIWSPLWCTISSQKVWLLLYFFSTTIRYHNLNIQLQNQGS